MTWICREHGLVVDVYCPKCADPVDTAMKRRDARLAWWLAAVVILLVTAPIWGAW